MDFFCVVVSVQLCRQRLFSEIYLNWRNCKVCACALYVVSVMGSLTSASNQQVFIKRHCWHLKNVCL